ncbi:PREDICTED: uncharacterized protein LOC108765785 [Trachymyrmex cornetzi]|uniref:uncharacterized protein LOC108765785 n=1 Tax=Trachymyrmex cornetzi TaxID=471704 RepID=UPI00084F3F18|nr:PREDICTED: uncharacterized protein LOC108765785 [Trachymyrmex cornetzi]
MPIYPPGPDPATTDNYVDRSHGDVDLLALLRGSESSESSTSVLTITRGNVDCHRRIEFRAFVPDCDAAGSRSSRSALFCPFTDRSTGTTRHGHTPPQCTFLPRAIQFSAPLTASMQYGTSD